MESNKSEFKKNLILICIICFISIIVATGIYFIYKFLNKNETGIAEQIKANNAVFISKSLEEFASNKNIKSSEIAKKISDELNVSMKNPFDKKTPAYTFEAECKGCSSVEADDNLEMIILTTYDKTGELMARTVIKPPSFVTYDK